jgi:hypothetical protein
VVVRSPAGTCLTVGAPELERRWARAELTSMASHRWAASYDEGDGRWAKALEPDDGHPLGRLVRLVGDRFESSYRIAGGLVTQVDRRIGRTRFTVAIKQREEAGDGRTLPTQFTVAHWSADDGRLLHADTCTDAYTRVDGLRTRQLTLSDHQLLTAEGYGSAAS